MDQSSAIDLASKIYNKSKYVAADFDDPSTWSSLGITPDVLICSDVIEHLSRPENLLKYIAHISNQNTKIFISTPNRRKVRGSNNRQSPNRAHVREWSEAEFRKLIVSSGFELKAISHHFPYSFIRHGILNTIRDYMQVKTQKDGDFKYNMLFEVKRLNNQVTAM